MERDLFTVRRMLSEEGLDAKILFADGVIKVFLGTQTAVFSARNLRAAADWLAAHALIQYPESSFSRLWSMLARAEGGKAPMQESPSTAKAAPASTTFPRWFHFWYKRRCGAAGSGS